MAQIHLSIRRDNGVNITAEATVEDSYVADIAMTLGAILFDASSEETPAEETPASSVEEPPVSG